MKNIFGSLFLWILTMSSVIAQSPSTQTDYLGSTGKIYVVIAVIVLIFIGILALLISMERRLARLEKEQDSEM